MTEEKKLVQQTNVRLRNDTFTNAQLLEEEIFTEFESQSDFFNSLVDNYVNSHPKLTNKKLEIISQEKENLEKIKKQQEKNTQELEKQKIEHIKKLRDGLDQDKFANQDYVYAFFEKFGIKTSQKAEQDFWGLYNKLKEEQRRTNDKHSRHSK
jgi:hypothetical protein